MKRISYLFALFLIPSILPAQQANCLQRTIPINAVDKQQQPVTNLSLENLSGKFHGRPVRFTSAKLITGPRRIVILLDMSGSMRTGFRYLAAAFVAADLLSVLPNGSRVGLITFTDRVAIQTEQLRDPSVVKGRLRQIVAVDQTAARGTTSLYDAIDAAVRLLGPAQPGDAIYAITDGEDTSSQIRQDKVEASLLSAGIRFFVALTYREAPWSYNRMTPVNKMPELTEATGGTTQRFEVTEDIWNADRNEPKEKALKRIREITDLLTKQLAQFYSVELELSEEVDKPRSLELKLVPDGKLQTNGLKLQHPTKLLPCSRSNENTP